MSALRDQARGYLTKAPRLSGAFLLLVGIYLLYLCAYQPLQDAMSGASEVKISSKGAVAGVAGSIFGLAMLVGGARMAELMYPPPGKSKVPSVVVGLLMVAVGFGAYFAIKSHIESLGYQFRF